MRSEEKDLSSAGTERDQESAEEADMQAQTPGRRHWPWLSALLLAALIGLGIEYFNWNLFKAYAERRVSAATGRDFHIDGDIDVRLSMQPLITVGRLRLGNIAGARTRTMASAQQLQFRIELWQMLRGHTIVPALDLVKPVVLLERDAGGKGNWNFPDSGTTPVIRQFTVEGGVLGYREDTAGTNLLIHVDSARTSSASQLAPLIFRGNGRYRNNPFILEGRADSPLDLSRTSTPYRIDVSTIAGTTHAHASGALRNPLQVTGFDLDFTLAGPDLGLLYKLIGVATPETPPYRLQGRLGHDGHVWSFDRFAGVVGGSDLAGDLSVDDNGRKKLLKASLTSRHLDVHDLAGFVGAPAHADPGRASTEKQRAEAAEANASTRVLPQQPYDLDRLRGMDADVLLRAQKVIGTTVPLAALLAHLTIKDGVVELDPMNFGAADGQVQAKIHLDASRPVIAAAAKLKLRRIDLGQLAPNVPMIRRSEGRIGADVDLKGDGNSIARMLATSDGRVSVGMNSGRISDLMMAYAGLNIVRIVKLRITGDHDVAIRCVLGDFAAHNGIWNTDTFVFDSADTVIRGTGAIDLRNERFDVLLKARPKYRSLLSLRSPLHLRGSFTGPSIRPDFKALGVRGIASAVLAVVAPPAAELALIEYGGGKNVDCTRPSLVTR